MPPIRFGGLASGLPPNLVEQIMASERMPIQTMEGKKEKLSAKLELIGDLEGRMRKIGDSMKDIVGRTGFKDYTLDLSREGVVSGSVDPEKAATGAWSVEVLKMPQNAGRMTNGFPDRDRTQVGVGYLKFDTPDGEHEVYINDSNNTLNGIVNAINQTDIGVRASVIKDADDGDYPHKIIFTSDKYGNNNDIVFPTVYLLDGDHDLYFDKERVAENGKIKLNGFEVEVDARKLDDIIPGVTLNLMSAEPGREVGVSISENYDEIKGKMGEFVKSMNSVLGFIQQQNKMDKNTDTTKTLGGDSMLRSVEMRIRGLIQSGGYNFGPGINRLQQLGVEFNREGTLNFDEDKFNKTLQSKPKDVVKFLRGDGSKGSGFIDRVKDMVNVTLRSGFGVVANRKTGFTNRIRRIDQRIENKEKLLARKEDGLRRKFSRLEETMSQLKAQGGAIGALGGGGGGVLGGLG